MRATDSTYSFPLFGMRGKEIGTQLCHRHSVTQSKQCFQEIAYEGIITAEVVVLLSVLGIILVLQLLVLLRVLHQTRRLKRY